MAIQTGTGASVAIGTTAAATTLGQFEADSYTVVGETSSLGAFGDRREIVEFKSLADGRVRKARGSANAGDMTVTFGYDSTDSGQAAVKAAFEVVSQSADEFNFRVMNNDSLGSNPTTRYFRARVSSREQQEITNDGIVMMQAVLAINSAIVEKPAA